VEFMVLYGLGVDNGSLTWLGSNRRVLAFFASRANIGQGV